MMPLRNSASRAQNRLIALVNCSTGTCVALVRESDKGAVRHFLTRLVLRQARPVKEQEPASG
jgi:hypothetical protein